ncbi:MAG: aminotransferase class IV [Bacteroidetes bacterium]|nr:aminotransferase class IV [Bacteroidota bacterium]
MYIETIKIENGIVRNLEFHNKRVINTIGKTINLTPDIPEEHKKGVVKYRVVYDINGIKEISFSPYTIKKIRTLKIVENNDIDYSKKYENRSSLNSLLEKKETCDDIIIVKDGFVTDTSYCNIIFKNEKGLFTPSTPLLCGTKRAFLLKEGIITEKDIRSEEIKEYQHIILINAMIELTDNITIDKNNIF